MLLFCFSERAGKKRKAAYSFQTISYEKKLSKLVKSINRWVMKDKKNDKAFPCNDISQIIRQICGISRRKIFDAEKVPAPALNRVRKSIYLNIFE